MQARQPSINTPVLRRRRSAGRPDVFATVILLLGCALSVFVPSGNAYELAHEAALLVGLALALGTAVEMKRDVRNVMRVDVLMLVALYGLIYLEFLFPQPEIGHLVRADLMRECLLVIALGLGGLAVGRHWPMHGGGLKRFTDIELSPKALIKGLVVCAVLGYLHMLWAVGFNPVSLIDAMMGERFSQPWGRGRLGGWVDLFHELGLLIYLIPPAAGVVYARGKSFTSSQKALAYGLLALTLFYGFSSGTRNIFAVYVLSFLGGYFLTVPRVSVIKTVQLFSVAIVLLFLSSQVMLEFRQIGLRDYLSNMTTEAVEERKYSSAPRGFFVDNNIYTLSKLVEFFPRQGDYLGLEVPYWAVVKPVPRAIWPGKPEGLSMTIEDVRAERGASAATWSATYLGEAFMSGGLVGVALFSLLFGVLAAWWNTLLRNDESIYRKLLYATGLFAAVITMRSLFWLSTAILPSVALIVYGRWFLKQRRRKLGKA